MLLQWVGYGVTNMKRAGVAPYQAPVFFFAPRMTDKARLVYSRVL